MNKQSNSYTIIYSVLLVLVVGIGLSLVYQALKPKQDENIDNDTKKQILAAVLITPENGENVSDLYSQTIKDSYIINYLGEKVESTIDPFRVDVSKEVKKANDERLLPIFEAQTENGLKYIVPVYGAGLWGPIWGYISFSEDGKSIYGAYFAHKSETPGLGAEIEKPQFQEQFKEKSIFDANGEFVSVAVVKNGQEPSDKAYVHAISGGTITSKGVQAMLENSLQPYNNFFRNLQTDNK